MKKLKEYKDILEKNNLLAEYHGEPEQLEAIVNDVSYNSMQVKQGTLFICKGANFKAQYLIDAIEKGAVCYVAEKGSYEALSDIEDVRTGHTPCFVVNDMRAAISKLSAFFFDESWNSKLKITGITGTKGKSTTATMIKSILDAYMGRETGFSSGIYTYDGMHREKAKKLTTPETIELHRILDGAAQNGCGYLTMEVSSQALKYDRTLDLKFDISAFLNISEDHISDAEHKDMEDYFSAKLRIFDQSRAACVNLDMDKAYLPHVLERAEKQCEKVITFGFDESADIRGLEVSELPGRIKMKVSIYGEEDDFVINIGGSYNSSNALAAIAAATEAGIPRQYIHEGLDKVRVLGRMELYTIPEKNVDIIVDYAHNKMSYEVLFDYVHRHYSDRKVGFLFGCVGGKAFNRRKEAGEIAEKNADFIVITEIDPGKEDINKICNDILDNIEHKEKADIVTDRDEAVRFAINKAENIQNCVLVLAGCGSEAYIKRGTQFVEFATDGERVQKYLDERKK